MTNAVGALILAAGFSHRFGSVKLNAKLNNGATVFAQTLRRVSTALPNYKVVTRPELAELLSHAERNLNLFDHADDGMGASLAYAIGLVSEWQACLVCLADMPFIEVATYRRLAENLQPDNIVIPLHQGQPGNPVGFGSKYFSELSKLSGDEGGRAVVKTNQNAVILVATEDAAILYDIDTPADLEKYQSL